MNKKTRLPGISYPMQLKLPCLACVFATLRFTCPRRGIQRRYDDVEDRENIDISRFEKKGYITLVNISFVCR